MSYNLVITAFLEVSFEIRATIREAWCEFRGNGVGGVFLGYRCQAVSEDLSSSSRAYNRLLLSREVKFYGMMRQSSGRGIRIICWICP